MKKKLIFSLLVLAGAPSLLMAADEARLLRFPATNGKEIVFSYAGDLYKVSATGGEASRLTSHVGYEMFPRFSPDGKTIAFTGQYDGNTEVYTIPVSGGEPLRVTYTATNSRDDLGDRMGPNNIVMNWTPDGSRIVYRNRIGDGFSGKLFTVDKEGGLSEVIPLPGSAAILPMANSWLITVSCVSSVLGNTTEAEWRMMSGSTIPTRRQSRTLRIIPPRTLSRCGSATKSSSSPIVTGQ